MNNPHKSPNGEVVDMNAVSMCQEYRTAYYLCKRSALDMRTRIQGQKAY